jgi:hypothetical protein
VVGVSLAAAGCALLYAVYRGYYGLGGTAGMIGTPVSAREWRAINLAAAVALAGVAFAPVGLLPLWRHPRLRRLLLVLSWTLAVGGVMHALIMDTERVCSLAGVLRVHYPASQWATIDRHTADVQDLAFNETWFLAEGMLWGALAWVELGPTPARRWWMATAIAATTALTAAGLLSAFGVIGGVVV